MRLIDADELKNRIGQFALNNYEHFEVWQLEQLELIVDLMPTSTFTIHGYWEKGVSPYSYICSVCRCESVGDSDEDENNMVIWKPMPCCPYCGSKNEVSK